MGSQGMSIDARLASALGGKFLVFDGPDGSGKSTQIARFIRACDRARLAVTHVRDPGGTEVGERIREVLLERHDEPVAPVCEMLLYMASRAHLVAQRIRPALEAGSLVVSDRFVASTLAYQGTAGGVAREDILRVASIACAGVVPDLTVIFDVSRDAAAARLGGTRKAARSGHEPGLFGDRMEDKAEVFHRRVREGYLDLARADPEGVLLVDGSGTEDHVWDLLIEGLAARLIDPDRTDPGDGANP